MCPGAGVAPCAGGTKRGASRMASTDSGVTCDGGGPSRAGEVVPNEGEDLGSGVWGRKRWVVKVGNWPSQNGVLGSLEKVPV